MAPGDAAVGPLVVSMAGTMAGGAVPSDDRHQMSTEELRAFLIARATQGRSPLNAGERLMLGAIAGHDPAPFPYEENNLLLGGGKKFGDGGAPFYRTYLTADRKYVAVGAMETVFWDRLVDGLRLDRAALPDQYDRERWPELAGILAEVFARRTRDVWAAELADACVSPVLTMAEAPTHPHNAARGLFIEGAHGPVPAPAPRFGPR